MHGSNRLGGNSLSDLLVFGRRAGAGRGRARAERGRAAPRCRTTRSPTPARAALAPFEREGGENPYTVQHDLQETMQDLVGIIRTGAELEQALERIAALKERVANLSVEGHRQYNPGWHLALDLPHMLIVTECIARAALEREESRGGHTRDDFPGRRPGVGRGSTSSARRRADGGGGSVDAASRCRRCRRELGRDCFEETHVHDATTRRSGCGAATPTGGDLQDVHRRR